MRKTIIASTFLIAGYVVASSASCGGGDGADETDGSFEGGFGGDEGGGGTDGAGGAAGTAGFGGNDGSGGQAGTDGSGGTAGTDGSGGAAGTDGTGGTAGKGGKGGKGGTAGSAGTAGTGGSGGTAGKGGKGGAGGTAGKGGKGGAAGSGGTAGKGGKGGSAGSGGTAGKGGKGGSSGKGGDAGGDDDGGYAFYAPKQPDRRHTVALAAGASESIPFVWHDASGIAPPSDLWIDVGGKRVLQVFSVGAHPFVRAGLDVVPIEAGAPYRLVLARADDTVTVTLVRASDEVVLRTQAQVADARTASNQPLAVVLPSTSWRSSLVTNF